MTGLSDWRGNVYRGGEPLGPVVCEHPTCAAPAVRHQCNAEGDTGRTHWHGEIHVLAAPGAPLRAYCAQHGAAVLAANERIRASR